MKTKATKLKGFLFLFILMITMSSFSWGQSAGDVIITEFMANPDCSLDADGEYFEIYNTTGSDINIDIAFNENSTQYASNPCSVTCLVYPCVAHP